MQSATKLRALAVEDALALDEGVDTSSDESQVNKQGNSGSRG